MSLSRVFVTVSICTLLGCNISEPAGAPDFVVAAPSMSVLLDASIVRVQQEISPGVGGFVGPLSVSAGFGTDVTLLGDADGDGIDDIAVGEPNDDPGPNGAVWILLLNSDGSVKSEYRISEGEGGFVGDLHDRDRFGFRVAAMGDLDGNGVPDLAVGADRDDDGGGANTNADRGAVWVLFLEAIDVSGSLEVRVKYSSKISDTQGNFSGALDNGDNFGVGLAALPDLNGNGVPGLAVGAYRDDDAGTDVGAVWILHLDTVMVAGEIVGVRVNSHAKITGAGFPGLDANDRFGSAVAVLGDLNGDGFVDLGVGAPNDEDEAGNQGAGAIWILYLNGSGDVLRAQRINDKDGDLTAGLDGGDQFGLSIDVIGYLDDDTVPDLAVGAALDEVGDGVTKTGAVWLLLLEHDGDSVLVKSHQHVAEGKSGFSGSLESGGQFGIGVAALGDLNGDGVPDLAVGERFADGFGLNEGSVWMLFLRAPTPEQQLLAILDAALGELDLNGGQANALATKLEKTLEKLDMNNVNAAINLLGAFINQVDAFIQAGIVTVEVGQPLIDVAEDVIAQLSS